MSHETYMQTAINIATLGLGRTWPNPSVGCVIVKDGKIIATSRTADGGRPHAETLALAHAGDNAKDASIYVVLEPCAHHGQTPPCAESLVKAGVKEVIIGCGDPDKRVSGKGIKILSDAGIKVTTGILEKECRELNKGFLKKAERNMPYVMLKAAISADGKYLEGTGKPRWITGEKAREDVHFLRSVYDAILTGTGTVLIDNPQLNVRLPGREDCSPVKIVIGNRPIPGSSNIFKGKEVWLYADDISEALPDITERGITRLMIETGPKLTNTMLKAGLVDEVIIYQSSEVLGKDQKDFFLPQILDKFTKIKEEKIGDDVKTTFTKSVIAG